MTSVLPIESNDFSVLPGEVSTNVLSENQSQNSQERREISRQIREDQQGGYILEDSIIDLNSHGVFYDHGIKILEWNYSEDRRLHIRSYTDKPVTLCAPLKVKECLIKAKGSLLINDTIESEAIVAVEAESLRLTNEMTSKGSIYLNLRQGVDFFATIKAKNLDIHAANVYQKSELQLSEQLEVFARSFKQEASAKTSANALCLIADHCEMSGDLTVNNKSLLTANTLIWGNNTAQTTFHLTGNNHIHARSLLLQGDMHACIGNSNSDEKGHFIIAQVLGANKEATVHFINTDCSFNEIKNQGNLLFDRCAAKSKRVIQQGVFKGVQSQVRMEEQFTHHKDALTDFEDCHVDVPVTNINGGEFHVNNSIYTGHSCKGYAGSLAIKNQSKLEMEDIFVNKGACATVCDSQIKTTRLNGSGALIFEKALVKAKYLSKIKGHLTSNLRVQSF